ncbi:MAG: hypothetical protein GYB66_05835 [Chloroflexi bacterium]|nr:hypothetical protein [Chloroflexota bacterium]
MSKPRIDHGKIIFRHWDSNKGLSETWQEFHTLEELFEHCLETRDPLLVDRVQIQGTDSEGVPRRLTLVFQSITVSESDAE